MGKCRQNATPLHRPILEHVVDGGQDGGDDGHDRLFGAAPGFDAVELSLQVAVFLLTAAQAHCTSVVTACEQSLKSENLLTIFCEGARDGGSLPDAQTLDAGALVSRLEGHLWPRSRPPAASGFFRSF